MASSPDRPRLRPFFLFGLFVFVWVAVPTSWKLLIKSGFEEFEAPLWESASRISDLTNFWGHMSDSKTTLIEKNKILSRIHSDIQIQAERIPTLKNEIAKLNGLKSHLETLEQQLGIDSQPKFKPLISRVTKRSLSGWWQGLTIRRGSMHGLRPGMGVIGKAGLFGRIKDTNFRSSQVELITNPNFRIAAHFSGDDRPVTFQGNGVGMGGTLYGIVTDVPHDLHATEESPLTLISSSLSGNYPDGLKIGEVYFLEGGDDGLFKTGKVILSREIGNAKEVTILIPEND